MIFIYAHFFTTDEVVKEKSLFNGSFTAHLNLWPAFSRDKIRINDVFVDEVYYEDTETDDFVQAYPIYKELTEQEISVIKLRAVYNEVGDV